MNSKDLFRTKIINFLKADFLILNIEQDKKSFKKPSSKSIALLLSYRYQWGSNLDIDLKITT